MFKTLLRKQTLMFVVNENGKETGIFFVLIYLTINSKSNDFRERNKNVFFFFPRRNEYEEKEGFYIQSQSKRDKL